MTVVRSATLSSGEQYAEKQKIRKKLAETRKNVWIYREKKCWALYIEETEKGAGKMRQYGYCRISTGKQNIERQVRNIQASYPEAVIVKETYTGTKFQGRKELEKILAKAEPGDRIIFDSVSRMSRNAEEGYRLYEELFRRDISLVFLKEPHINRSILELDENNSRK